MFAFGVQVFKHIKTRFFLFCFELWQIDFEVCFAILGKVTVMFDLIRPIAFNAFLSLSSTCKSSMFLFPAVLVLENTWVHVCTTNSGDIALNVKIPIKKTFSLTTTLDISYVQPNDSYI